MAKTKLSRKTALNAKKKKSKNLVVRKTLKAIPAYGTTSKQPNDFIDENGEFQLTECFKSFTEDGGKPLDNGDDLKKFLKGDNKHPDNPYAKARKEIGSCYLFLCDAWDKVLKTQYLVENKQDRPSEQMKLLEKNFIQLTMGTDGEEFDFTLFGEFAKWVQSNGIAGIVKAMWYDLPSVLRIIAPTETVLWEADFNGAKYWEKATLKGLPTFVINLPWELFRLVEHIEFFRKNKTNVSEPMKT